jgi:hypothetical protein
MDYAEVEEGVTWDSLCNNIRRRLLILLCQVTCARKPAPVASIKRRPIEQELLARRAARLHRSW